MNRTVEDIKALMNEVELELGTLRADIEDKEDELNTLNRELVIASNRGKSKAPDSGFGDCWIYRNPACVATRLGDMYAVLRDSGRFGWCVEGDSTLLVTKPTNNTNDAYYGSWLAMPHAHIEKSGFHLRCQFTAMLCGITMNDTGDMDCKLSYMLTFLKPGFAWALEKAYFAIIDRQAPEKATQEVTVMLFGKFK